MINHSEQWVVFIVEEDSLIVGKGCVVIKSLEASDKSLGSSHVITGNKKL